jgi:hypothetical protein
MITTYIIPWQAEKFEILPKYWNFSTVHSNRAEMKKWNKFRLGLIAETGYCKASHPVEIF